VPVTQRNRRTCIDWSDRNRTIGEKETVPNLVQDRVRGCGWTCASRAIAAPLSNGASYQLDEGANGDLAWSTGRSWSPG
jgi:hypothetical protein